MKVTLLNNTPLWVADKAIGKCWDKPTPDKLVYNEVFNEYDHIRTEPGCNTERIERVALKHKHASTIEHLNYTFDIDSISRACLQELARHRMASLSVKSTRYTLKELKGEKSFYLESDFKCYDTDIGKRASKYLVFTKNDRTDHNSMLALENLRQDLRAGVPNDLAKYCIPEAYKTSLVWTINARSLQNFLALRTNKAALWEIRELAYEVFKQLPEEHKFLFEDSLYKEGQEVK